MTPLERQLMQMVSVLIEQLKEIDVSIDRLQNSVHELEVAVTAAHNENINGHNHIGNLISRIETPEPKPIAQPKEASTPESRAQKAVDKLQGLFDVKPLPGDDKDRCILKEGNCKAADCPEHGPF